MSDLEYSGKVKGMMTFKEHEQARLLKAMVIPASELAKRKQEELERANAFTRSVEDESFYARTESSVSPRDSSPIGVRVGIVSREPFDELP
ncbi:hypothetical protein CBI30_06920 [Polynucleobacter aenigmaticus]|uniref:Uncharacterized protein n=1 Tax=Polynucleobacter aenigmaticus TaxID=1743164 RepID=A0A254Q1P9_9BURK|nr:hypothetical protein [Polynucleobacter aenigmaticus]OWS71466.1 hypothetical protein CBI30_06920 [Polynucleobacter aenigmaticus]